MKLFGVKKEKFKVSIFIPFIFFIGVLIVLICQSNSVNLSNRYREKAILEDAVNRSLTQCYALEGFYPYKVDYLVDEYGLTYNKDRFYISYQYIGANLRPDITIIDRS